MFDVPNKRAYVSTTTMRTLEKLTIKGFKSIREQELELSRLNVFIGSNGSGKSNLIGSFRFLHNVINQRLADYTAKRGGADTLLYYGRRSTPRMSFDLVFGEGDEASGYQITLAGTDESGLTIEQEKALFHKRNIYDRPYDRTVAIYAQESQLRNEKHVTARTVTADLDSYRVYHFHDTSDTAPMKGICDVDDNRTLRAQAQNLPAFLYYQQERHHDHFSLIEDTVRQIAPFFGKFELQPSRLNESKIRLAWQEKNHDNYFNATSLSDGTLRFICLATLLLQPELPSLVLLDEPELGLHPAAITLLADLLLAASQRTQIMVATQSVTLVNRLTPEHVWTVNREDEQSVFSKLSLTDDSAWLDDYSLGELWEKNIIEARP